MHLSFEDRAAEQPQGGADGGQAQGRQQRRRVQEEDAYADDDDNGVQEEEQGEQEPPQRQQAVSLFVYVATEDGSPLQMDPVAVGALLQQPGAVAAGNVAPIGGWQLHVRTSGSGSSGGGGLSVNYLALATPHMHNLTEAVRQSIIASMRAQHAAGQRQYQLTLPDVAQPGANLAVFQVTALLPLALDLAFVSGLPDPANPPEQVAQRVAAVSGVGLQQLLAAGAQAFEQRFAATFPALAAGNDVAGLPPGTAAAARAALSNMLGGMGYFYGYSLVRVEERKGREVVDTTARLWDTALYSGGRGSARRETGERIGKEWRAWAGTCLV